MLIYLFLSSHFYFRDKGSVNVSNLTSDITLNASGWSCQANLTYQRRAIEMLLLDLDLKILILLLNSLIRILSLLQFLFIFCCICKVIVNLVLCFVVFTHIFSIRKVFLLALQYNWRHILCHFVWIFVILIFSVCGSHNGIWSRR